MAKAEKSALIERAKLLGAVTSDLMTEDNLKTIIERLEKGPVENCYNPEDHVNETGKDVFQEVRVIQDPTEEKAGKKFRTFKIVEVLRPYVTITPFQAAVLNSGRRQDGVNRDFTLFLRPGTVKVDPVELGKM